MYQILGSYSKLLKHNSELLPYLDLLQEPCRQAIIFEGGLFNLMSTTNHDNF